MGWRPGHRRRAAREAAGTLSGYALGIEDDEAPAPRDVLADVLEVLRQAPGAHWDELAQCLADRWPERWANLTADALSMQCRPFGVPTVTVSVGGQKAKGCRRVAIAEAVERSGVSAGQSGDGNRAS